MQQQEMSLSVATAADLLAPLVQRLVCQQAYSLFQLQHEGTKGALYDVDLGKELEYEGARGREALKPQGGLRPLGQRSNLTLKPDQHLLQSKKQQSLCRPAGVI